MEPVIPRLPDFLLIAMLASATPAAASALPASLAPDLVPIALMQDAGSGQILFARDIDRRFMPASITKVMTSYIAFELIAQGKLKPDQMLPVSDFAYENWSGKGSSLGVKRNSFIPVDTLIDAITTVSGNDAAIVLAQGAAGSVGQWVAMMNRQARDLGMTESHFATPNGWMDEGRTFVSARDLGKLAHAMLKRHPALYARHFGKRTLTYNGITQTNHDPISGILPGADGIKTGYTKQAGYGFLGTAKRDGTRLIFVVAGTDSSGIRQSAARDFLEWGFAAFDRHQLLPRHAQVGRAKVQGGEDRSVQLIAPVPITILVPKGKKARYSLVLHYLGPVEAPIRKGQAVGELEVLVDGHPSHRVPVVAQRGVGAANLWQRLRNGLMGLFA